MYYDNIFDLKIGVTKIKEGSNVHLPDELFCVGFDKGVLKNFILYIVGEIYNDVMSVNISNNIALNTILDLSKNNC